MFLSARSLYSEGGRYEKVVSCLGAKVCGRARDRGAHGDQWQLPDVQHLLLPDELFPWWPERRYVARLPGRWQWGGNRSLQAARLICTDDSGADESYGRPRLLCSSGPASQRESGGSLAHRGLPSAPVRNHRNRRRSRRCSLANPRSRHRSRMAGSGSRMVQTTRGSNPAGRGERRGSPVGFG